MVGPLTKRYIYLKARKQEKMPMGEMLGRLREYEDYVAASGCRLVFTLLMGAKIYEANSLFEGKILASPPWAVRLITRGDEDTRNAFMATLSHELAHKEVFFEGKASCVSDMKFLRWVLEVHCDFRAAQMLGSRARMLRAIDYKIELKKDQRDWPIHPSWKQRREYIGDYDYDDELIDRFARDVGCTNAELIGQVKEYCRGRHIALGL